MPIVDVAHDSNDFFFITGIRDSTFTAGKNAFVVHQSAKVVNTATIPQVTTNNIKVYDPAGNVLNVYTVIPTNAADYDYSEGKGQVFGVVVYPNTPSGVGRIEITATAFPPELTGSIGLLNDQRFSPAVYKSVGSSSIASVLWSKAINFCSQYKNESEVRFFDFPEMVASSDVYEIRTRPVCSTQVAFGGCNGLALNPRHGSEADYDYNVTSASFKLTRMPISGAASESFGDPFSSSMVGSDILLSDIEIVKLGYISPSTGLPSEFSGSLWANFMAKVAKVQDENTLYLDRPFTVSSEWLDKVSRDDFIYTNFTYNDDTPYREITEYNIKRFDSFNEVDFFPANANASGVQKQQVNQIYNVGAFGVSHRKNYKVSNIQYASYEITHLPRCQMATASFTYTQSSEDRYHPYMCMAKVELNNLRTWTGAVDKCKIYKRSLNYPETPRCVFDGPIPTTELIWDWFAGADYAMLGEFIEPDVTSQFWLTSSNEVRYHHTPKVLIDSITITSTAKHNVDEANYIILKNIRPESGSLDDPEYLRPDYVLYNEYIGSIFETSPKIFLNFAVEPSASYSCSFLSGSFDEFGAPISTSSYYIDSKEVVKSGSMYNSNFVKLTKNTMYELSMQYMNLVGSGTTYRFIVYFVTTKDETWVKIKLGELNNKTTRGFFTGKYSTKIFIPRTMYGTIMIVPIDMTSVTISNFSLRPFKDSAYPVDSAVIRFPVDVRVKGERIEFFAELFDSYGRLIYGDNCEAFGYNRTLSTIRNRLRDTAVVDPQWWTLEAVDTTGPLYL